MVEKKFTSGEYRFHSANEMQYIEEVLEHLIMAATAGKDIVSRLMEAVEALTQNNVSLATQLSNTMKINLDMAEKIKLKPTQEPKENKLEDKGKRKEAFEKILDPDGYYWTHGFLVTKRHIIQTCSVPAAGH